MEKTKIGGETASPFGFMECMMLLLKLSRITKYGEVSFSKVMRRGRSLQREITSFQQLGCCTPKAVCIVSFVYNRKILCIVLKYKLNN